MERTKVKVEIVFKQSLYENLSKLADEWGFSSTQSLLRFLAASEMNLQDKEPHTYADLNSPKVQALRLMELILMSSRFECKSLAQALDYLYLQLTQRKQRQHLDKKHWTRLDFYGER